MYGRKNVVLIITIAHNSLSLSTCVILISVDDKLNFFNSKELRRINLYVHALSVLGKFARRDILKLNKFVELFKKKFVKFIIMKGNDEKI